MGVTTDEATSRQEIMEAASMWFARLDSGTADIAAFEAWRDADPRHQAAFARIAGVGFQLDRLKKLMPAPGEPANQKPKPSRRSVMTAAVIGVGVITGVTASLTLATSRVKASTDIGESRSIALPGGGQITLNTDSKASWKFNETQRQIWLERGEIAVVLPDDSRVAILHAGDNVVSFAAGDLNARLRGKSLDLTVIKGSCTLGDLKKPAGAETAGTAVVTAGEAALVQAGTFRVRAVHADDLQFVAGWRAGELVFNGQTLGTAIAEYNRYLPRKIVILDPSLQDIRLGGRFNTRDPADFLNSLNSSFGIHVERDGSGAIMLSR